MRYSNVLLTGAAGKIGSALRKALAPKCDHLRISDLRPLSAEHPSEEAVQCDLNDADGVRRLCEGMDAVIHMGGRASDGPWPQLLQENIVCTMNLLEAARINGADRVLFASSNHVTGMYPIDRRIAGRDPVRPDSIYGLTKAFGEDATAFYAFKYGVRGFCMRIGTFAERPAHRRALSTWCSPADLVRLVEVGLSADYVHEIVYGVSKNTRSWWDNSAAERLGYQPLDDAEDYAFQVEHIAPDNELERNFQGADRVSDDFSGREEWLRR
ncbi:NAD(P)-dependent oxidoreductase [Chelativorans sp. AA-79]|uniref:NAD-dependent epimerase/dehydratase family protein n=1 Tax=Chelativorans sp. AA-79 TaxID=3028735 RepID=UPI0023F89B87|nr:NAD(P)-dependent oxidoreductase [Chelativorans sp. AA-79]WEX10444.1 NAD(P)-dependent oxidoreductase [Chelativorans sp. AA-79]